MVRKLPNLLILVVIMSLLLTNCAIAPTVKYDETYGRGSWESMAPNPWQDLE